MFRGGPTTHGDGDPAFGRMTGEGCRLSGYAHRGSTTRKPGDVMATKRLTRLFGCVLVLGVGLTMASCTTTPEENPSGTPVIQNESSSSPSGDASDLPIAPTPSISQPTPSTNLDGIEATGGFGEAPEVTIPSPWAIDSTKTKILVQGTGATVDTTGYVDVNYYGVNARTGEYFDDSYSRGTSVSFPLNGVVPGFAKGLTGQKVGTRLIIAMPGADGYDSQGGNSNAGIEIGDTLVFVVDILKTQFAQPTGTTVTVNDASLPTVSGDLESPTVTIPSGNPPTSLVVQPLITGPDADVVVEATDGIVVDYAEYIWDSGKMVRQTYGFSPLTGKLSDTIPGWQQALAGQPLGSRVLLVVPPAQAYPQGAPKIGIPQGSTMVYVIDILFSSATVG